MQQTTNYTTETMRAKQKQEPQKETSLITLNTGASNVFSVKKDLKWFKINKKAKSIILKTKSLKLYPEKLKTDKNKHTFDLIQTNRQRWTNCSKRQTRQFNSEGRCSLDNFLMYKRRCSNPPTSTVLDSSIKHSPFRPSWYLISQSIFHKKHLISEEKFRSHKHQEVNPEKKHSTPEVKSKECSRTKRSSKICMKNKFTIIASNFVQEQFIASFESN